MSTTRLHNIETNILSTDSIYSLLGCMLGETGMLESPTRQSPMLERRIP